MQRTISKVFVGLVFPEERGEKRDSFRPFAIRLSELHGPPPFTSANRLFRGYLDALAARRRWRCAVLFCGLNPCRETVTAQTMRSFASRSSA